MLLRFAKLIRELNSTVIAILSLFGMASGLIIFFRESILNYMLRDITLPIWFFLIILILLVYVLYWVIHNRPEQKYKPITVYEEVMDLKWRIMVNPKYWLEGDASKFGKEYCDNILADPDCPQCNSQIIGKWSDKMKFTNICCVHCGHESAFKIGNNMIGDIPTQEAKFMVIQGLQRHFRNKGNFKIRNNDRFQFTLNQLSLNPERHSNSKKK